MIIIEKIYTRSIRTKDNEIYKKRKELLSLKEAFSALIDIFLFDYICISDDMHMHAARYVRERRECQSGGILVHQSMYQYCVIFFYIICVMFDAILLYKLR